MLNDTKQLLEITRKNFRGKLTHLTIEVGRLEWLIEQAEKANQVEKILCCGDYDEKSKLDNINYLFFDE